MGTRHDQLGSPFVVAEGRLANLFGVSRQAMAIRLEELDLVAAYLYAEPV
jgi:Zn-dependent peptidase ImmA (M78 family)